MDSLKDELTSTVLKWTPVTDDEGEGEPVDVVGIDPISAFASDSEPEDEIFSFETKIKHTNSKEP